jgi:hypothetical protein
MRKYFFALIALSFYFAGCSNDSLPTEAPFNSQVNGKTLTVAPYQRIKLELDLCADAGYQWDYVITNTDCFKLDSLTYKPKDGTIFIPGGMTVETFYFHAENKGQSTISLAERQEWLKNVPPIDTVRFTVYVK